MGFITIEVFCGLEYVSKMTILEKNALLTKKILETLINKHYHSKHK